MANAITPQAAYPTAEQVMNRARAFVNDAFRGGKGRILTDQAPFTIEYLNSAIEDLQDLIGNNGVITLIKDNVILGPITPIPALDPTKQVFISYQGYFDSVKMWPTPVLPSDCFAVLECWEQQVGSGLPFSYMGQPRQALPSRYQGQFFYDWEYRQDRINMLGSTTTEQLRIRYESRFPSIANNANLADTQIAILASVNSLATYVAYVYARARGAQAAAVMQTDGDRASRRILRRYSRRGQSRPYRRNGYGASAGSGDRGVDSRLPY